MMTGCWLLRPASQVRDTWSRAEDTVVWMVDRCLEQGIGCEVSEDKRRVHAVEQLMDGNDVVWGSWVSESRWAGNYLIVCPNRFWPGLFCPLG